MLSNFNKIAQKHIEQKNYNKALEIWDEAANKGIDPQTIALKKADIFFALRDYEKADSILIKVIKYKDKASDTLLKLCHSNYYQKKLDNALKISNKVYLMDDHNKFQAILIRGLILRDLDRTVDAIEAFIHALQLNPSHYHSKIILIELYNLAKLYKEALPYLHKLKEVKLDPQGIANCLSLSFPGLENKVDTATPVNYLLNNYLSEQSSIDNVPVALQHLIMHFASLTANLDLYNYLGDKNNLINYWIANNKNHSFILLKNRVKTIEDRENLLEIHKKWGTKAEKQINPEKIKRPVTKRLNNKIRLGFLSSDFIDTHVGYFIWPLISNLDNSKFEIYAYDQGYSPNNPMHQKFKSVAQSFKNVTKVNPISTAQAIADDNIDALIEIAIWYKEPELLAYRPAPIQISWLDYLHSIGLPTAIDYLALDKYILPSFPNMLIEKPLILPETWVTIDKLGFPEIPITEKTAEDNNGFITFGVINATYRLNENSFKVWANIMHQVPNSKLIYLNVRTHSQVVRENFCRYMAQNGISPNRISFISEKKNFLPHFNEIDIALDTFPHMGTTTTCYTLWMGVPLVTLVGPCFFERVSYSALMNCGLSELCAFNLEQYKEIALMLAKDRKKRKHIRAKLRSRILNGPLGQHKRFADNMGAAIAEILGKNI